ncbi:MAG: hypothetical protein P4L28_05570 [Paludibacteraceae bacterium]|nr:hypothetical protein [Paludibacteraceae bacterium]
MKKIVVFLALISTINIHSQIINKSVVFHVGKNKCLQKTDLDRLIIAPYTEAEGQEWVIVPSDESGYYYLKTNNNYYLKLNTDTTAEGCLFSTEIPATDDNKFKLSLLAENNWQIANKLKPNSYLQPNNDESFICVIPPGSETEIGSFRIDTVAYRRPKPRYTHFEELESDAGILIDEKEEPVYGADATFYKGGGAYPTQLIVRIFTSTDRKDRIEIYLFDDILRIRKTKTYTLSAKVNNKKLLTVLVFKRDKIAQRLTGQTCKLSSISFKANTMELCLEKWELEYKMLKPLRLPVFDIAFKGVVRIQ